MYVLGNCTLTQDFLETEKQFLKTSIANVITLQLTPDLRMQLCAVCAFSEAGSLGFVKT